jgi:ATP-dependent RNA helicase DHX8/PRP22
MDDLENLEFLSLVSKITSEIHNHLGISDKTLAEFIIDQHSQCESLNQFKEKLESLDADFPNSLIGKSVVSVTSLPEFIGIV